MEARTRSAFISLPELEQFIGEIKAGHSKVDGVRVYFIRFRPEDIPAPEVNENNQVPEGCKFLLVKDGKGNVFSQLSIAIVPVIDFQVDENYFTSADDQVVDDTINVLMPGAVSKATGLNPPSQPGKPKVKEFLTD
jgi:hypothetical protein